MNSTPYRYMSETPQRGLQFLGNFLPHIVCTTKTGQTLSEHVKILSFCFNKEKQYGF